jgi:hypothetical protein
MKTYTMHQAIHQARLATMGCKKICLDSVKGRSYGEVLTIFELSDIVKQIMSDTEQLN